MPRKRKHYPVPSHRWERTASGRLTSVPRETRWPHLFPELLQCISERLPLRDLIAFRQVCRAWRAAPSGRAAVTRFSKTEPWLLIYDVGGGGKYYLCDQLHPACCTGEAPELAGATCIESIYGWLLAHRGFDFFFYEPLSFKKVTLPRHPAKNGLHDPKGTFTAPPTSSACVVAIVEFSGPSTVTISTCRFGVWRWEVKLFDLTPTAFNLRNIFVYDHASIPPNQRGQKYTDDIYVSDAVSYVLYSHVSKDAVVDAHSNPPKGKAYCRRLLLPTEPWLRASPGTDVRVALAQFRSRNRAYNYSAQVSKLSPAQDGGRTRGEPRRVKGAYFEPFPQPFK